MPRIAFEASATALAKSVGVRPCPVADVDDGAHDGVQELKPANVSVPPGRLVADSVGEHLVGEGEQFDVEGVACPDRGDDPARDLAQSRSGGGRVAPAVVDASPTERRAHHEHALVKAVAQPEGGKSG